MTLAHETVLFSADDGADGFELLLSGQIKLGVNRPMHGVSPPRKG
jgi:hypothetical protein